MVPVSIATAIATRAHRGQKRADGAAFIEHPLAVIEILMSSSTHLPSNVYAAAVLHDVLEDTELTYADLVRKVGRPIATVVLGLTRPRQMPRESQPAQEMRYLRQMRTVQTLEPCALLIKMADRIHNLETKEALPRQRRDELLHETRTLYLPFFHSARREQPQALCTAYDILLRRLALGCATSAPLSISHMAATLFPATVHSIEN